jgi:hypothetical protein
MSTQDSSKFLDKEKEITFGFDPKTLGDNLASKENETFKQTQNNGKFHSRFIEPFPDYDAALGEKVLSGENNTWIVFGRDRPSTKESGYGALPIPRAGTIDIVVGRGGPRPSAVSSNGQKILIDSNFKIDSARIYISQKTDIDKNFFISSKKSPASTACSAIGIKSDSVRIIGNRDVKIVTGIASEDSNGRFVDQNPAIYFIGNNDDSDIQPIVKGNNLVACLYDLTTQINNLNSIVTQFLTLQNAFNNAVITHSHISPFQAKPTSASPQLATDGFITTTKLLSVVKSSLLANVTNVEILRKEFLERFDENSRNILSDYVFTN